MADSSDLISGLVIGIIVAAIGAVLAVVLPRYVFKKRVSDKELFEYWRNNVFDRRSFQGRMKGETHNFKGKYLAEFHRGIEDTITCIKTGICRRGESGVMEKYEGHGYSTIRKKEWKENMKTIVEKLNIIEVKLKDMESSPAIQGDDPRGLVIDDERDKIVEILNGIWNSLGIEPMRLPTDTYYEFA